MDLNASIDSRILYMYTFQNNEARVLTENEYILVMIDRSTHRGVARERLRPLAAACVILPTSSALSHCQKVHGGLRNACTSSAWSDSWTGQFADCAHMWRHTHTSYPSTPSLTLVLFLFTLSSMSGHLHIPCMHTSTFIHANMRACTHTYTHTHTFTHTHTHTCACTHACTHAHAHAHRHTHTEIHTHTHTPVSYTHLTLPTTAEV